MLLVRPIAELDAAEAEESAEPLPKELSKEWYVSGFLTRTYPIGGTLKFDGEKILDTRFDSATGGGLKIGVFPSYKSIFGAEFEASGQRGRSWAPQTVFGNTVRSAQLEMTAVNFMVNALARYPSHYIQPYAGVGLGFSILRMDGHTQNFAGIREPDSLFGLTLQGIIGVRLLVTNRLFGLLNTNLHCFMEAKVTGVGLASTEEQVVRRVRSIASAINPITCQSASAFASDL